MVDYNKKIIKDFNLDEVFSFINPNILYGTFLGLKKDQIKKLTSNNVDELNSTPEGTKLLQMQETVNLLLKEYGKSNLTLQAVYQFFKCHKSDNSIILKDHGIAIPFIRQNKDGGLCLCDFVGESNDEISLFSVSAGKNIDKLAHELKDSGEYVKSFVLQSLAASLAEGLAEYLHKIIRKRWEIEDRKDLTLKEIYQAKYVGKRYSFGHASCPTISNQKILFDVLDVTNSIGVKLTDGFMMEPEASVSAIVFKNPDAKYFNATSPHCF